MLSGGTAGLGKDMGVDFKAPAKILKLLESNVCLDLGNPEWSNEIYMLYDTNWWDMKVKKASWMMIQKIIKEEEEDEEDPSPTLIIEENKWGGGIGKKISSALWVTTKAITS